MSTRFPLFPDLHFEAGGTYPSPCVAFHSIVSTRPVATQLRWCRPAPLSVGRHEGRLSRLPVLGFLFVRFELAQVFFSVACTFVARRCPRLAPRPLLQRSSVPSKVYFESFVVFELTKHVSQRLSSWKWKRGST